MAKKRRKRVPEVIWRLFKERARTLAKTITSLLSDKGAPSLFQPGDPSTYHKLLNNCFVVLDDNAPPLAAAAAASPSNRWPQNHIVRMTIEIMLRDHPATPNIICSQYNKSYRSSPAVELLSCSSWELLLKRIGDDVMVYLLKHTSIFAPLLRKKHYQVTGHPVSNLVPKHKPEFQRQHHSFGPRKKRDRSDNTSLACKKQKLSSINVCGSRRSVSTILAECNQTSLSDAAPEKTETRIFEGRGCSNEEFNELNLIMVKPKKHSRAFRWQRRKKHMHLEVKSANDKIGEVSSCRGLQSDLNIDSSHYNGKMLQQCFCCLVSQASQAVTDDTQINRLPIFYNSEHSSLVLLRKHALTSLKPSWAGSRSLFASVFGLSDTNLRAFSTSCLHKDGVCLQESTCLYHSLLKSLKVILHRTQRCKHLRLLDKHCVVSSMNECTLKWTQDTTDPLNAALKSYCSKSEVVSFIWAVCRNVVPPDLLGTPSNWRILRRNIYKFVQLRRFEKFTLEQCMHKLKTHGFPFLSNKQSSCHLDALVPSIVPGHTAHLHKGCDKLKDVANNTKHILLQKWIFWFFSVLVVPLVQANFYVTESEFGKHDVYYYRKSIWDEVKNRAIARLKDQNYQNLDIADVRSIISCRSFGFSKLRLLPKGNGVRILANLKASSRMPHQGKTSPARLFGLQRKVAHRPNLVKLRYFKSVNCFLRETHAVLKGIQLKEPENLGSSVFDYNDTYRKLCPFIIGLRNGLTMLPDVFIVVCDVSKAFDSIDQDKLLGMMGDVILEDKYFLKQFCQVVCTKKSLWVHEKLVSADPNVNTSFASLSSSALFGSLHTIVVNQGRNRYLLKEELLFNLKEHVKRNVLQLGRTFYLQGIGIPQGSVLSSLLCSLYYGNLERSVIFPFLDKLDGPSLKNLPRDDSQNASVPECSSEASAMSSPRHILLRLIDDFLFISTSKKHATGFLSRLRRGFRDYNCYMNEGKFCCNFDIGPASDLPSNRLHVGEDGKSFLRWSGLLLNSSTLEVQADYTRYLNNHLSSSLTVCWQGKPGSHLKMKVFSFLRPKCHPIFFDSNINSSPVVRLNIYQAFLLCAMKFHCYASAMSYIYELHPRFCFEIVERSLRYMYVLIRKRMRSVHVSSHFRPILQLEKSEVEWLGLNAYIEVLKRKQTKHKELLSLLLKKMSIHRITGNASSQLKYAVDCSHSCLMWKIKY